MTTPNLNPLGIRNFGAFTLDTAQRIQQAIAQMGLSTTGNVYYLDPVNGYNGNNGLSPTSAVQSLAAGYALLASGKNDVLVLISNGASSGSARLSAGFTWAKDAAHLVGVCSPVPISQRARIAPTSAITAFANFFTVSGNGCVFANLQFFQGFNVGVAAEICLTVTGSRNAFVNCHIAGMGDAVSAGDAASRSLLISGGGQENYFNHCTIGLDTVPRTLANASVEISGGGPRNVFEECFFLFDSTDGLQYGILGAAAAALDRWLLLKGCQAINSVGSGSTTLAVFLKLAATVGGIVCFDQNSALYGFTAIGDATTKAQTWLGGGTATNGVKGVVAT